MADPALPPDLAAVVLDLRARLDRLERSSVSPLLNLAGMHKADDYVDVATMAWSSTWEVPVGYLSQTGIHWRSVVTSDAGTTGSARLVMFVYEPDDPSTATEVFYTSTTAIPAAGLVQVTYDWAPGWPVLDPEKWATLRLDIQRTGGSGSLYAIPPAACFFASASVIGATATGV